MIIGFYLIYGTMREFLGLNSVPLNQAPYGCMNEGIFGP